MPVFTSSIELSDDYPSIQPSLNLNFARSRALDPRITFTRNSVGTYVDKNGLIKTAGKNEPRFDHDPVTLESLGLLIEESRTNNALYSDDFSNGAWVKQTSHGLTSNTTLAPDGTQNADTFNRTATNQYIYQSRSITGTHTMSVWVKTPSGAGNHDFVMQHFNGTDGGLGLTTFTATEEWQRFSIQASPTITGGWYPCIPTTLSQDYHVWGCQIEQTSFPSSYIPTSGAAVTRAVDSASITGESFSSWYNQSEGTVYSQFKNIPFGGGMYYFGPSGSPRWWSRYESSTGTNTQAYDGSGGGGTIGITVPGVSNSETITTLNHVIAIDNISQQHVGSANGSTVFTGVWDDTSGVSALDLGRRVDTNSYLNGHISRFAYYPKRLPDAQLQLLTS